MASYNYGKQELKFLLSQILPKGSTCLDVGACDGAYYELLKDLYILDGVEVWKPNIERYRLGEKYRKLFPVDIRSLNYGNYDLVIFGDIIEHLTIEEAQKVLDYAKEHSRYIVVAVPYMFKQGAIYGNPYEEHLQPDLTNEVFLERYTGFELKISFSNYGYYLWKKE